MTVLVVLPINLNTTIGFKRQRTKDKRHSITGHTTYLDTSTQKYK